jgi:hypothetical protein
VSEIIAAPPVPPEIVVVAALVALCLLSVDVNRGMYADFRLAIEKS